MNESDIRFSCQNSDVIIKEIIPTPSSKHFKCTWKLDNFFSISCKKKHMISSELLSFNGYSGKCSVFPNGTVTSYGDFIVVLYLNTGKLELEKVPEFCEIGIESNNVKIIISAVSISKKCLFCNFGNLKDVITELSGPEDSLTIFCKFSLKDDNFTITDPLETERNISFKTNHNSSSSSICGCDIDLCILTDQQCVSREHALQKTSVSGQLVSNIDVQTDEIIERPYRRDMCVQTQQRCSVDKILQDFQKLLLNEDDSDITLNVKEHEFKAHRCILSARTPVFAAVLKQNMSEKNSSTVALEDCEPNIFQEFLHYVYTGSVKRICHDNVFSLYKLSDKYQVKELKDECAEYLKEILSVDTFCDVLTLALKHDEQELFSMAKELFCKEMKNIIVTAKWLTFICENPSYVNELLIQRVQFEETGI